MKIAALDIGLKRIGVALCPNGSTVLPQPAIIRINRHQAAREVREFIEEWGIDMLVVGIPRGGSSEDEMSRRIDHFVSLLELQDHVDVVYQDEAGSSMEAKEYMQGRVRQKRDGRIDSISAQIILERWLENQ
jgi:putative Holliday junction resolvase